MTLGSFQHLQTVLAASVYVEVYPGLVISPGSTVLFTATLFAVLLVYIREDAGQARSLIVGVVAANLTLTLVSLLTSNHLGSELLVSTGLDASELLGQNLRTFLVGTGTLIIDVVLIIILFEFFFALFPRNLFLRIFAAMLVVVTFDTLVFVSASFFGSEQFVDLLRSGIIGKAAAAFVYSILLTGFLRWFQSPRQKHDNTSGAQDIFQILTYRQRYKLLQDELTRDAMTGLYNRGFFNQNLDRELARCARLGHRLCLVVIDIDHFKAINDNHGHQVGDQVIIALAEAMTSAFRHADMACRFGGEEFVVIMPDAPSEAALNATRRLQTLFADQCAEHRLALDAAPTFSAGIASYPGDAQTPEALLRTADERMYKGKRAGRNRIETTDADGVLTPA